MRSWLVASTVLFERAALSHFSILLGPFCFRSAYLSSRRFASANLFAPLPVFSCRGAANACARIAQP